MQGIEDIEILVIGDCCTDDTEEYVKSLDDERIRFYNLEKNSGQQAAPTNYALSIARGQYIAFLNQDDMYLPGHLKSVIDRIEKDNADFILSPSLVIQQSKGDPTDISSYSVRYSSMPYKGTYIPYQGYIASTWLIRNDVFQRIGPWKMESSVYVTPSQEWLFRAYLKGLKIVCVNSFSVILIHSGGRPNFYNWKESPEHAYFFSRLGDEDLKADLLSLGLLNAGSDLTEFMYLRPMRALMLALGWPILKVSTWLGIHPLSVIAMRRHGGRGGFISYHRKKTGLDR